MSFSCIRLSKICFLLSVITCTVLLLLIPKFQSSWRFKIYPQPHPSLIFNTFNKKDTPLQQVEFNSPNPLDAEIDNIVPVTKENLLEKWNHHVTDTGGFHLKDNGKINERPHNVIHMESAEVSAKEKLELKDIFIAVKTTRKYHKTRLNLLFQTWISQAKGQTFVFTDGEDRELHLRAGDHIINTNCSAVHTRQALCCKMSVEYDKFLESGQKWFCHVDDDNYVNLKSLLSLLSAFSHSQDIYIGRPSLDHPIEAADHLRNDGSKAMELCQQPKDENCRYATQTAYRKNSNDGIMFGHSIMITILYMLRSISLTEPISLKLYEELVIHKASPQLTTTKFWFATGGAGFCISRGLALKMSPWASLGSFISTAERIRLPDDCTIGYIIEGLLEVKLLHSPLFHSHLENLQRLRGRAALRQVTLSYGGPENKRNVVSVGEVFSIQQDPTRFKSVHCLLYPETLWCPTVIVK